MLLAQHAYLPTYAGHAPFVAYCLLLKVDKSLPHPSAQHPAWKTLVYLLVGYDPRVPTK